MTAPSPDIALRRARYREALWWGEARLQDLFDDCVRRDPQALSLVDPPNREGFTDGPPQRLTWAAVHAKVQALCGVLLDAGLRRGDVVVIQLPAVHEALVAYIACFRLGLVASPVPTAYRAHELTQIVTHTRAGAVLAMRRIGGHDHGALWTQLLLQPGMPPTRLLLWGSHPPDPAGDLHAAMAAQAVDPTLDDRIAQALRQAPVGSDDIAVVLWTSGTEAQPKPVPRTHNQCLAARKLMTEPAALELGDCILSPRLLNTMGGLAGPVLTWLDRAAKLVLHQPFDLPIFLRQVAEEAPVFTSSAPAVLMQLLADPAALRVLADSPLRCLSSGSAALPEEVMLRFKTECGIDILNFYGSSEGGSLSATPHDMTELSARAQYFARFGAASCESTLSAARYVKTRLIDPETQATIEQPGVVGELCFEGPMIFDGYLGMPEATRAAFTRDGEYRSGDLFMIAGDRGQWLRFVGRRKEIIVRGGINLSALELEGLMAQVPGVAEAAVIGLPDERLGEIACAVVVPQPGSRPTLAHVARYLQEHLSVAVFKCPEALFLMEGLPLNPAGKVMKSALRQQVEDAVVRADLRFERRPGARPRPA